MGTWTTLRHQPGFNASTMLLLTDGTVMCHDEGPAFGGSPRWHKLTPDHHGSYIHGTWSALAHAPNSPLFFASAVLKNGRVFVAGGEYDDGLNWDLLAAQIYNPVSNIWSVASVPPGWSNIGDAPCCMLPDGRLLLGSIGTNRTAIYDPDNNTWVLAANKQNPSSSEETWTLLPDETILSVDCQGHPGAQKYIISRRTNGLRSSRPRPILLRLPRSKLVRRFFCPTGACLPSAPPAHGPLSNAADCESAGQLDKWTRFSAPAR